ncbi:MAG: GNAT family N-acetyltransferase [Bacteroidales bacterium]
MFTVEKFSFDNTPLAEQAFAIRRAVFVEEQGVDATLEYDHEEEAQHYLLFLGEKPIATARWRETEKGIKLERFAVLPHFRNRGIGEIILREVIKDVVLSGKPVYLHAQLKALSFYERNGFKKEGPLFVEAGIDHFLMKLHEGTK